MEDRLNALLHLAIKLKATDIHFTRTRAGVKIEMRVDDRIRFVKGEAKDDKMIRYLQYLANLDVGNLILPQTGQFEWFIDDHLLSLRFALIHNPHMDNAVLRILNDDLGLDVKTLSTSTDQNVFFRKMMRYRSGLYIFSGPTGSGKTTSLYTLLHGVKGKKIFTIEDPIEIHSDEFIQIGVNETIGLSLDAAIRQVLRHDPDIIMIGELRDELTAKMAIRAANTGHLVFTSIHAASCLLAIERLLELGVNKGQLYNVLVGISNQRLFKRQNSSAKVVIYETMGRDEIVYYFKNGAISPEFYTLEERIEDAKRQDIIAQDEVASEFSIA